MRRVRNGGRSAVVLAVLALIALFAGCGPQRSGTPSSGSASAQGNAKLPTASLATSFYIDAADTGYLAGAKQGFYQKAGVNLNIVQGKGADDTLKQLLTGKVDFALVDGAVLAQAYAKDPSAGLVSIANVQQSTMASVIYVKGRKVHSIQDLRTATFGNSGGSAANLYPAFVRQALHTSPQFKTLQIDPATRITALFKGRVDTVASVVVEMPEVNAAAKQAGLEIGVFPFKDYDFNPYGYGIVTTRRYLESHGDVARAVVQGSLEGWRWSAKNPDAAADILAPKLPNVTHEQALAEVKEALPLVTGGDAATKGLGHMSPDRWGTTVRIAAAGFGLKHPPVAQKLYESGYLPKSPILV